MNAGQTQNDFARRFGIEQASLSFIENGHVAPSITLLTAIVKEYGTTYEWLIEGKIGKGGPSQPHKGIFATFIESLGRNLRSIMRDEKLGQAAFAKRSMLTRQRLSDILDGEVIPGAEEVLGILNAFPQYNANWLLKNEGSRKIMEGQQAIEELLRQKDEIVALMQAAMPKPAGAKAGTGRQ